MMEKLQLKFLRTTATVIFHVGIYAMYSVHKYWEWEDKHLSDNWKEEVDKCKPSKKN